MVGKKRLPSRYDYSDSDTSVGEFRIELNGLGTTPSPPQPDVVKSPEKLDSKHAGEETSNMSRSKKKRKATLAYSARTPKILWSKDDELVILKGFADYRNETGMNCLSDSAAFVEYIKDEIDAQFSKDQLMSKIRKLKAKFRDNLAKNKSFTKSHDSQVYNLSMAIWGKDQPVNGSMDKANGTKSRSRRRSKVEAFVEHEVVTNGEAENDDGSEKGDSCHTLPFENDDGNMENGTGVKESEEDEAVTNSKPENDDGSAKSDSFVTLPFENVDEIMDNGTAGKESEEDEAMSNCKLENDDGSAEGDSCDDKLPSENVDEIMENVTGGKESEEDEAMSNGELENGDGSAKNDSFDYKLPSEEVDKCMENWTGGKESEEDEAMSNGKLENGDGSAKSDSFDNKLPSEEVDKCMENGTGGKESEEDEAMSNGKLENDDGSAEGDSCDDKLPSEKVDKSMEKETGGKGSVEDGADDDLCALQDALETTMFQHLSNDAQKLMLQKLRSLRAKEKRELSDEWKTLLVQEVQFKSKKQSFVAKLAEAALQD